MPSDRMMKTFTYLKLQTGSIEIPDLYRSLDKCFNLLINCSNY